MNTKITRQLSRKHLLNIIFILLSTISYSQKTFAPLGATWYYNSSGNGTGPSSGSYYLYQSQLDTVVAGHACKKITVLYCNYLGVKRNNEPVFTYQENDTVFYYNSYYLRYFPLYIFNVAVGDTMTYHSPHPTFGQPQDTTWKAVVTSVTNYISGTDTLKKITTAPPLSSKYQFGAPYIEKIGCLGLMLHNYFSAIPEADGPLRCYSDSTASYKWISLTKTCDYFTNGIEEIKNPFGIYLFPNPASTELNIKSIVNSSFNFTIYNALGQLVQTGSFHSDQTQIDLDHYSEGMYNIELTADHKTERKLFIIQK